MNKEKGGCCGCLAILFIISFIIMTWSVPVGSIGLFSSIIFFICVMTLLGDKKE